MSDNDSRTREATADVETDGGVETDRESVDYLDARINIFKPATPFMRDHLKLIWTMFIAWAVLIFGPVTATYLAPDFMTSVTVLHFPLHYLLTAIGAPLGALILSYVYARKRDQLDVKYGIDHATKRSTPDGETVSTDGGVER
ncbi:DUF4212 domain-containing protein [Haladaptatus salinisoli]|uniref:DUF4212 domain-containing protein n=1 Tax=Haladaptatus salinisoli TaxID=2884876 RepID=UPI001D0B8C5D|nr:DUF4212 domain-containing protein [Haladaptatus salinisoli]